MSAVPVNMNSLPDELLLHIISYLDLPPPSMTKFDHEPSSTLTCSDEAPLKSLSLVSRHWRLLVIPTLYSYSRIALDDEQTWVTINRHLLAGMKNNVCTVSCDPVCTGTLSDHELEILDRAKQRETDPRFDQNPFQDICRVLDGDTFLADRKENHTWLPSFGINFCDFTQFVAKHNLKRHIKSMAVLSNREDLHTGRRTVNNWMLPLWPPFFQHLQPSRLVVAAPPPTLETLLNIWPVRTVNPWSDPWFGRKMHYVEFCQHPLPPSSAPTESSQQRGPELYNIRPWSHTRYNHGIFHYRLFDI